MSRLLDLSLDEISKQRKEQTKPKARNGGRNANNRRNSVPLNTTRSASGRRAVSSFRRNEKRGNAEGQWEHDLYSDAGNESTFSNEGGRKRISIQLNSAKVFVSGLDFEIMSDDLKDIFSKVGPVKSASINFDKTDRSAGTGYVIFESRVDASKAVDLYNGAEVNGQIIKVKLMSGNEGSEGAFRVSAPSSRSPGVSRTVISGRRDAPMRDATRFSVRLDGGIQKNRNPKRAPRTNGNRGNRSGGRVQREVKTSEELDREMDEYQKMTD